MDNYTKVSDFNPEANYTLVKYGAYAPLTQGELNETQQILKEKIYGLSKALFKDVLFEVDGVMSYVTSTKTFNIKNQTLNNLGDTIFISNLNLSPVNLNDIVYLKVWEHEVSKNDSIHKYGNQQEITIENHLEDPTLHGAESARRVQLQYDLTTQKESQDGVIYIPLAQVTVENKLQDKRVFHQTLNYSCESKDDTNCFTIVTAKRTNGTIYSKSFLKEKSEQGNYTNLTVDYYNSAGDIVVFSEVYKLGYDNNNTLQSKELI